MAPSLTLGRRPFCVVDCSRLLNFEGVPSVRSFVFVSQFSVLQDFLQTLTSASSWGRPASLMIVGFLLHPPPGDPPVLFRQPLEWFLPQTGSRPSGGCSPLWSGIVFYGLLVPSFFFFVWYLSRRPGNPSFSLRPGFFCGLFMLFISSMMRLCGASSSPPQCCGTRWLKAFLTC